MPTIKLVTSSIMNMVSVVATTRAHQYDCISFRAGRGDQDLVGGAEQTGIATQILGSSSELPQPAHKHVDDGVGICKASSSLTVSFERDDESIPPAFYRGQEVPVALMLDLDEDLSLDAHPALRLHLVSTLSIGGARRPLSTATSSLDRGLELWAAGERWVREGRHRLDLKLRLPCDGLPPTFAVRGAKFSISYAIRVQLTFDPDKEEKHDRNTAQSQVVTQSEVGFELLHAGVAEPISRIMPYSVWIPLDAPRPRCLSAQTERWVLRPQVPSTFYGPTESIPLVLHVHSPERATMDRSEYVVLARASLVRLERVSTLPTSERRSQTSRRVTVRTRHACTTCNGSSEIDLRLAVSDGPTWEHGFTTHIEDGNLHASSRFQVRIDTVIMPREVYLRKATMGSVAMLALESDGAGAEQAWAEIDRQDQVNHRTIVIPIDIGSAAEPHQLNADEDWSVANGWVLAPPSYSDALGQPPYVTL